MLKSKLITSLLCTLSIATTPNVLAGIPDPDQCHAATRADQPVSILAAPDGGGTPINMCYGYGVGAIVDATIDVWLLDYTGDPVFLYPASDIWLETADGSTALCPGGSTADQSTDIDGHTTFSQPLYAGACGIGILVIINGTPINQPPLDMRINSPDIDGDLNVNLTDVVYLAELFYTDDYCADFYWDGIVNLSDVVVLAPHLGAECP
jgi:hypothetical protein